MHSSLKASAQPTILKLSSNRLSWVKRLWFGQVNESAGAICFEAMQEAQSLGLSGDEQTKVAKATSDAFKATVMALRDQEKAS